MFFWSRAFILSCLSETVHPYVRISVSMLAEWECRPVETTGNQYSTVLDMHRSRFCYTCWLLFRDYDSLLQSHEPVPYLCVRILLHKARRLSLFGFRDMGHLPVSLVGESDRVWDSLAAVVIRREI